MIKKYKIIRYNLYLLFAVLPFANILTSISLVSLLLLSIYFGNIDNWKSVYRNTRGLIMLPIVFYMYHVVSILINGNYSVGLIELEHKMSFLAIPLLLPFAHIERKHYLNSFKAFVSVTMILSFIVIGEYLIHGLVVKGGYFGVHRSYMAMYFTISAIFILHNYRKTAKKTWKLPYVFSLTSFFIATLLLNSKAGIIIIIITFVVYILVNIRVNTKRTIRVLVVLILSLFFGSSIYEKRFSKLSNEVENSLGLVLNENKKINNSLGSAGDRMLTYKSAIEVIADKPVFGSGVGETKSTLKKQNIKNGYIGMVNKYVLNAHNDYLEVAIELGILGLIMLLSIYISIGISSLKTKDYMIGVIYIVFLFNGAVESMLVRQAGIIPFVLFGVVYIISTYNKRVTINK